MSDFVTGCRDRIRAENIYRKTVKHMNNGVFCKLQPAQICTARIVWRDWLVENLPTSVLPERIKGSLRKLTVKRLEESLGQLAERDIMLGPLDFYSPRRHFRVEQQLMVYLCRWYGNWCLVFEEVIKDADA